LFISYGFDDKAFIFTEDLRYMKEFEDQGVKVIFPPGVTFLKGTFL
jgi:hypothetical protein